MRMQVVDARRRPQIVPQSEPRVLGQELGAGDAMGVESERELSLEGLAGARFLLFDLK